MKDYIAITNAGRSIAVKARSENGAWKAALKVSGDEWIVSISYFVQKP